MRGPLRIGYLLVAALLVTVSAAVFWATRANDRTALELARLSLEGTARGLAASAEASLRHGGRAGLRGVAGVFADRVVAYALVVDGRGTVIFHTNPAIEGTLLPPGDRPAPAAEGFSAGLVPMGTGLTGYRFDTRVTGVEGHPLDLRIVLHSTPADLVLERARTLRWTIAAVLGLLWAGGGVLLLSLRRLVTLEEAAARRERMALVGQMTATLAHEIRNTLGSLKGFAQLADEKTPPGDPRKESLAMVTGGAIRLEGLVTELLLFAREESLKVGPVDLPALADEATAATLAGWEGRATIDVPARTWVRADREKLLRALVNVLRNAREAAGPAGSIAVAAATRGKWVTLAVTDSGPGLLPETRGRLFQPFFTTKADGTGLGLAYARKVTEGMGGTIDLDDAPGGGAVLTFRLRKGENRP
jgi:two-component system sensor histidine kinase HydH